MRRFVFQTNWDQPEGAMAIADADGQYTRILVPNLGLFDPGQSTWSPDSTRIAYSSDEQAPFDATIYVIDAAGGRSQPITDGTDPAWSPDGGRIAFIREEASTRHVLFSMAPDGTDRRRLWPPPGADKTAFLSTGALRWSSDGRQLAYRGYSGYLWVINADGTGARAVTPQESRFKAKADFQWSPTKPVLVFTTRNEAYVVDPTLSMLTPIAKGLNGDTATWSPDGTMLALPIGVDLWVVSPEGDHRRKVLDGRKFGAVPESPQWEPGGRRTQELLGKTITTADSVNAKADAPKGVLRTPGVVGDLSADGNRVALEVVSECPHVEIWDRGRTILTRFPATYDCSVDYAGVTDVALVGRRATWVQFQWGNHLYLDVLTASPEQPLQLSLFSGYDEQAGYLQAGDGLLAFTSWRPPGLFRPMTRATLWRASGDRSRKLRSGRNTFVPVAVDGGRILVQLGGGRFEMLNAEGRHIRTLTIPDSTGVVLGGDDLVVMRRGRIEWLSVTGRARGSWPTGDRRARLESLEAGLVVYVASGRIHLLRLRDGKQLTLSPPSRKFVRAKLDKAGLFYSYAIGSRAKQGRVAFLPLAELQRRFG